MSRKFFILGIIFLAVAGVSATALFLYPYRPTHPPLTDSAESTPQGKQRVVAANNQFAFKTFSQLAKKSEKNIFYSFLTMAEKSPF